MKYVKTAAVLAMVLATVACNKTTGPDGVVTITPEDVGQSSFKQSSSNKHGAVVGTVEVDGEPAPGVKLKAYPWPFIQSNAPEQTAITGGAGDFTFRDLESAVFIMDVVSAIIDGYECEGLPRSVIEFTVDGEVKTIRISCTGRSGPVVGELLVSGGDTSHDPFVFNAGKTGTKERLTFRMGRSADTIVIESSTFGPSALPPLTGRIDASGRFTVKGQGLIAGIGGVSVVASGRLERAQPFYPNGLVVDKLVVGGSGKLPKGTAIIYTFNPTFEEWP